MFFSFILKDLSFLFLLLSAVFRYYHYAWRGLQFSTKEIRDNISLARIIMLKLKLYLYILFSIMNTYALYERIRTEAQKTILNKKKQCHIQNTCTYQNKFIFAAQVLMKFEKVISVSLD